MNRFTRARRLFRRGLALCSLLAILSLWVQIDGLAGSRGLLPAARAQEAFEASAWGDDWRWRPTLLWLDASDGMLHGLCAAGAALALLMALDLAPALCALLLWAVYLSLCWACGVFLNFQWDTLLLETLLVAAVWLPWRLGRERRDAPDPPCALGRWLVAWIVFRLLFESGVVKLTSGDPTWRDLSAMTFHYMTQPLPHGASWWVHHLPRWVHQGAVLGTFAAELVAPFLVLAWGRGRHLRHAGAAAIVGLQLGIGATGNYGFFGLLTIVLCLPLLDDRLLRVRPSVPARLPAPRRVAAGAQRVAAGALAVPIVALSALQLHDLWGAPGLRLDRRQVDQGVVATFREDGWLPALRLAELRAQPFLSVNAYGLFRVMTTERPGVRVQGSLDGETWVDYPFRWQVDALDERPGWAQPHMPRLDWQLWFESLRRQPYRTTPWFGNLLRRLLDAEPAVLGLLAEDPFDGRKPRAVRATLVDHRFTTPEEHAADGAWWVETPLYPIWITVQGT